MRAAHLLLALAFLLLPSGECAVPSATSSKRDDPEPHMFSFRTSTQHRKETKASDGTVMGEFGYQTSDGFYITTVYGTDEKGKYAVMETRKEPAAEARRGKSFEEPPPEPMPDYRFEYTSFNMHDGTHHHEESGGHDGSKMGSYWWDDAEGYRHQVVYVAEGHGFMPMHSMFKVL